ncbi:MAG: radical SAM family heme chaperone HemW [Deltaproteobacteria bacterium]|nr:radical SAM family heme chaperone HemW [Deltaproteobacteria bacterium]
MSGGGDLGVYVHVPFCERVCPYCDFAVVAAGRGPLGAAREARYLAALLRELEGRRASCAGRSLETIYLGGGTPSLLRPETLARVLAALRAAFPGEPAEVTLELNPGTLECERLPGFRAAGVSRLSIGVQSFGDAVLRRLGRAHPAADCHRTLRAARAAGFRRISLDLIFGAPGQNEADVLRDAEAALAHGPEHISAYALTVEPGTPLARAVAEGRVRLPGDDACAGMMSALAQRLEAAGLRRYELSSFARPGCEARHNRRYWRRQPVLGLGPGAHSSEPPGPGAPYGARSANERGLSAWLARIESAPAAGAAGAESAAARARAGAADGAAGGAGAAGGGLCPPVREVLDGPTARGEAAFLALRQREGLAAAAFAAEFGAPPRRWFAAAIDELLSAGLLAESPGGDLRLTPRAWPLADSVFAHFVAAPR